MVNPQRSTSPAVFRTKRQPANRQMHAFACVAVCLVLGVMLKSINVSHAPPEREQESVTFFLKSPHDDKLGFDAAFQVAYNEVIVDSKKSCRHRYGRSDCHVRKRIDLNAFPYKTRGGLADSDRELIADLYFEAESVFEYGIGESTMIAAATNLPRYAGIDNSAEWISTTRSQVPDRFRFSFADVGPTREWGNPVANKTLAKMALDYQLSPLQVERDPFDVYLVDGRWRVACVMASFLHAIKTGGDMSKVRVILHDYSEGRSGSYGIVESIATVERRSEKAVVLVMRDDVATGDLFRIWMVSIVKWAVAVLIYSLVRDLSCHSRITLYCPCSNFATRKHNSAVLQH